MALKIITADERLAEKRGHKIVVCGQSGVGKTTLARTLDPDTTLFMDLEAGDAAIERWPIDVIRPKTWEECRDFACFLGGPNPALTPEQPYSVVEYERVSQMYGDSIEMMKKYDSIFVDSITVAGRLCFQYCLGHPDNKSDRTGKIDTRAVYGMQNLHDIISRPCIVDEVITMAVMPSEEHGPYRAFVCQTLNQWGYPAKDRSGQLEVIEEPHLGKLLAKISGRSSGERDLNFVDPNAIKSSEKGDTK